LSVFRGLLRVRADLREKARPEVLNYLIDNVVVEQYLTQLKIDVGAKDIDDHIERIKTEAKKAGQEFPALLKKLYLTEDDLRRELVGALKWDKFVLQQAQDKVLRDMFEKNVEMFNGSTTRARHILIKVADGKKADAEAKVVALKKQIETDAAQELAKLPTGSDKITVEKERAKALDKAFGMAAEKESSCPSKSQGGDLGYFPRTGAMVEAFARVAFALKPYQLSEPVTTEFGVHLIMTVDARPGKDVKFEDVKPYVQDVYGERLREAILTSYKPKSTIVIREKKG
jgi:peptidyl-prolyl cis-trans isomerase C